MSVCIDCGCNISNRGPKALRCIECAKKHTQELKRKRKKLTFLFDVRKIDYAAECQDCFYYNKDGGHCDYAYRTGQLRTMLHPGEPLNNPCHEYKPDGGERQ